MTARLGLLVLALLALAALLAPGPSSAHYSLPGGNSCEPIVLAPGTDAGAFDVEVKRITCRNARHAIKAIAADRQTGFRCKHRGRSTGDADNGIAHTDYSCRKDRKRLVFAVS